MTNKIRIIEALQSIRLMFKNVNHIYKYTAISNNTICVLWHVLKPETPKRNHRNETTETTETTKTKRPKRNDRNETKRGKRNDRKFDYPIKIYI